MTATRAEILRRIRGALADVPPDERPDDVPVGRDYLREGSAATAELVERFAERVAEYRATVRRVDEGGLPSAIAAACAARGVQTLVVPDGVPDAWLPDDVAPLRDPGLSYEQLDQSDGVLTGCAVGVAQTGTLILDGGPAQGRRALTLLPDYHLCVIRAAQIVGLVPEALGRLAPRGGQGAHRPLTLISGPSATSDIELSRVEGVHGPRVLEVIIVE